MHIKGTYLNSILEEEIYMKQLDSFNDGTRQVLKLNRVLYGLKQVGPAWHQKLKKTLINLGFSQSSADECIFIQLTGANIEIITVYVDDLGLFSNTKEGMGWMKNQLNTLFQITDLGEMKNILRIHVQRDCTTRTLNISQEVYIDLILAQFSMQEANPVLTPVNYSVKLNVPIPNAEIKLTISEPYVKVVGSLMYAALGMRPNIAFAIQHLSQFTKFFSHKHWTAIKHVLRYLKGTKEDIISYKSSHKIHIEVFVNSDFANPADPLSICSYIILINGSCVSWSSKKQRTVALSTTEAKHMALTKAAKEVMCLHKLLINLRFHINNEPISMQSDNLGIITLPL